jgi:hypothetical protein
MYAEFFFALIDPSDPIDPTCSVVIGRKEYVMTSNALASVSTVKYKDVHILWIL